MTVRELIERLLAADPNAVILHLEPHDDASDAQEVHEVMCLREEWTCERRQTNNGTTIDVNRPARHVLTLGWNAKADAQKAERVVVLSSGRPGALYD